MARKSLGQIYVDRLSFEMEATHLYDELRKFQSYGEVRLDRLRTGDERALAVGTLLFATDDAKEHFNGSTSEYNGQMTRRQFFKKAAWMGGVVLGGSTVAAIATQKMIKTSDRLTALENDPLDSHDAECDQLRWKNLRNFGEQAIGAGCALYAGNQLLNAHDTYKKQPSEEIPLSGKIALLVQAIDAYGEGLAKNPKFAERGGLAIPKQPKQVTR